MKINIFYKHTDQAWGGGNQFLKALRQSFEKRGVYEQSAAAADVVIFNGYQEMAALIWHFFLRRRIRRVYRLGPVMSLHRSGPKWKLIDRMMAVVANVCADVIIFQSQWSLDQARKIGFYRRAGVYVIQNAVDSSIFYPKELSSTDGEKVRLVYTSWSKNENKGFSILKFLDNNLDFNRYHMLFIGNTPVTFKNITASSPVESTAVAEALRNSDIFVSPSKDDACSNAILEALACGLPVIALNSGGNGALVGSGGILFTTQTELLAGIEMVAGNLATYRANIRVQSMDSVTDQYLQAIRASIR